MGLPMLLTNKTKAQLLEMLATKGISAKPSMKKDELIALLENSDAPTRANLKNTKVEAAEPSTTKSNDAQNTADKPGAALPVLLVVGLFVTLAIMAWIILS